MLPQVAGVASQAQALTDTAADWLWLVPVLPFAGFVMNGAIALFSRYRPGPNDPAEVHGAHEGQHSSEPTPTSALSSSAATGRHRFALAASVIGPLMVALSFALTIAIFLAMRAAGAGALDEPFIQRYFSWMATGDLSIDAGFQLDQLAMTMMLVVTGVGFLIHVFSVGYMRHDPGYPRYFAYLNLFIFFMLVLVMGSSYPVMFVGWEGVGLCSYLLIGFWFSDKANADAGKKAFIVNRIGDLGFLVALFLMFANIHAFGFGEVAAAAASLDPGLVTAICLFLFLGCAGKSAQIPLYVWLPDAMAGPTPVSALIHAATMVTAGVYLVVRSAALFALSPAASLTVATVGALTALFAATIGLKQWDIKRVLAYSTVSQLGYMFVAVGVGAYAAGMFHLVTHAFFKALLFLGSGAVIHAMHAAQHHTGSHDDAQDMRNMGGLRRYLPVTFGVMWIATLAIVGIPPLSGFFSKDEILGSVFARARESTLADSGWLGLPGSTVLYTIYFIGIVTALLTAIYMTRMMLYTFHGPNRTGDRARAHLHEAPLVMTIPLVILAVLSAAGGWLNLPGFFTRILPVGPHEALSRWLEPVVGNAQATVSRGAHLGAGTEYMLVGAAVAIAITGITVAVLRLRPERLTTKLEAPAEQGFEGVLAHKYYVDEAYDAAIVQPMVAGSRTVLWRTLDAGIIDGLFVNGAGYLMRGFGWVGSKLQTGGVGTYAWVFVIGVIAVVGLLSCK